METKLTVFCSAGEKCKKDLSTLAPQVSTERKQLSNKFKHLLSNPWQFKLELAVVCITIVIVWGLLSLPVIFYHLPHKQVERCTSTCTCSCIYDGKMVGKGVLPCSIVVVHGLLYMVVIVIYGSYCS